MKKLIIALFAFMAFQVSAQKSFYKGALVTDLNYGVDIYQVHFHYELKVNPYTKYDHYDKAGSKSVNFGGQYGVNDWFGLGVRVKFDNYITAKDSVSKLTPTANGLEIGLITDCHMIRAKHFDLSAGLDIGYSNFTFNANDIAGNQLYGSGLWTNVHIIPRVYFGPFGFNIALNFPAVRYNNMTYSNSTINQYINPTWKGSGTGLTFGIQFRFLKAK